MNAPREHPASETLEPKRRLAGVLLPALILLFGAGHAPTADASGSRGQTDGAGITCERRFVPEVPWSINVLRIDRSRTNLLLTTTLGKGSRIGLNPLSDQLETIPRELGRVRAAINGDFYALEGSVYAGDPRGLHILRGELISAPIDRACFWIDASGEPHIGEVKQHFAVTWANGERTPFGLNEEREGNSAVLYTPALGGSTRTWGATEFILEPFSPRKWLPLRAGEKLPARIREIRRGGNSRILPDTLVLSIATGARDAGAAAAEAGDVILISTATQPDLKGTMMAIGGGPALVHNGRATPGSAFKAEQRHPRSAIGWNSREFLFVVVDGRQPRLSVGMTVPELARLMSQLGCDEGMNLDGGSSAELWMDGRILNSPCFGRERSTASAIVVVERGAGK